MGQFDLEEGVVEACFMEGLAGLAGRSKRRPARQTTKTAAKPRQSSLPPPASSGSEYSVAQQSSGGYGYGDPATVPPGCWRGNSGGVICP